MENKINKVKEKLRKYHQLHILDYYEELTDKQKECLINQVEDINFELLTQAKQEDSNKKKGIIEPIAAMKISEIAENENEFLKIGLEAIKNRKVGAVLLAGGQGTRLGLDKPKGMLNVGINRELYLFEQLINNILEVVKKANTWIPLFIMTSFKNNQDTIDFFNKHNYFGYHKDFITFFVQEMAPSIDYEGKIYMEDKHKISLSPNGNGGWFSSLAKHIGIKNIKDMGIEWLNVFSVDNVLQKIADPYFIGATIKSGFPVGSKVIKKAHPNEKVGVMCKEDGKPSIVEYYELTEELITEKDSNGELAFNYGVILNYLFRIKDLENTANNRLPLHIVEKKIPYMDKNGQYIYPEQPNGYKFETLVLDMIHMVDDCLVYEVERSKEFAPIKNKEGVDSLVTAREMLISNGVSI